jgi:ABC-type bacteriocin/lantibiotic exporter with double-glycine peptidase domain
MPLSLKGIGHRYGTQPPVLIDIDLDVGADETVAIIGPSG